MKKIVFATAFALLATTAAHAGIVITEVDPAGSTAGNGYSADWFELTNTGPSAVNISGWRMDDNSNNFALSVALRGVTSIAAGQSVVFIEGNATGTTDATIQANFIATWFGGTAPAGLTLGNYGGSGVGLSQTTDAVNIFDSAGTLIYNVSFGVTTLGATLDNAAGLSGAISQTSVAGVNGAFLSSGGLEVGSPGTIANAVPEPTALGLLAPAALALGSRRRRA